jgi:hypothetical protein
LKACFDPLGIDSLHKGRLTVYFSANGTSDSLRIGKGKDGKYWLDHNLDDSCRFVTLKMQTGNMFRYSKTVLLDKDYTDLQFFPESGELVHGLPSKIGFKAVDVNGKGVFVQGDIVDQNDSIITAFESNALGMGSFVLPVADKAKTYYARMVSKQDPNQLLLVPLPQVSPRGNTLSAEKRGDRLLLVATSNYMDNTGINLVVSCRGMVYFNQKVTLKDGVWGGAIPASMLPEGIIACTMLDNTMQPVAERLFFNQRPEDRIQVELNTDKDSYAKREKTSLNIKTVDHDGEPLDANLSVLVISKGQLGELQSKGQNIMSYFLLDSELKGEIETPGYYFNGEGNNDKDLDALMLTQGWRKYLYSKPYDELPFKPEQGLSITGRVTSGLFNREQNAKLTMMSFGDGFQAIPAMTDSAGRFIFNLDDEYGDAMRVVIQSAKESGKNKDYTVSLDHKPSPPVNFTQQSTIAELDSVVVELVRKDEERQKVDEVFWSESNSIMIGQVDVDGYKRSPQSRRIIERAGEPEMIIDGKKLLEEEEDWSYGLYCLLSYNSNYTISVYSDSSYNYKAYVMGTDATLVLVDGVYDRINQHLIPTLSVSEVSSIDIIKCADNFKVIYMEATGEMLIDPIFCGSIININTNGGKGIYNAWIRPKGINKFKIPVFATPKEFYSPNYENLKPEESNKPDLRALLHWQAILATDSSGTATTSFYNADNVGDMTVVVEAISDNGKIGYKEMDYQVEGKQPGEFLSELSHR